MTMIGRAPKDPVPLSNVAVLLDKADDVAIAKQSLLPGTDTRTTAR